MINNHFHPPPIHNTPYTPMPHPSLNGGFPRCPPSKHCEHNPSPLSQVPQQVQTITASLNSPTYGDRERERERERERDILYNLTTTGTTGYEIAYILYFRGFKTSGEAFRLPYSIAFDRSNRLFLDLSHWWLDITHPFRFFGDDLVFFPSFRFPLNHDFW
jgi:hypothetical protein